MMSNDFFDFSTKLVSTTVHASPQGFENERKDEDIQLIRGEYVDVTFPVVCKQAWGKKWTDILETGFPGLYLISDRLKSVLEENQLTGWQTYPIRLYDKKGNEIFGYHGFSIIGRCDAVDFRNSPILETQYVPKGTIVQYYKGYAVAGWKGTDFFLPEKTQHRLMTQRAADVLKKNKITNLRLTKISEDEFDVRIIKPDHALVRPNARPGDI